jgi:hypothetical protein
MLHWPRIAAVRTEVHHPRLLLRQTRATKPPEKRADCGIDFLRKIATTAG